MNELLRQKRTGGGPGRTRGPPCCTGTPVVAGQTQTRSADRDCPTHAYRCQRTREDTQTVAKHHPLPRRFFPLFRAARRPALRPLCAHQPIAYPRTHAKRPGASPSPLSRVVHKSCPRALPPRRMGPLATCAHSAAAKVRRDADRPPSTTSTSECRHAVKRGSCVRIVPIGSSPPTSPRG